MATDGDAGRTQRQAATTRRQVLYRVEHAGSFDQAEEQYRRAVAEGFDGIELVLTSEMFWPSTERAPGESLRAGALAARCTRANVSAASEEVASLLARADALQARCLNLIIPPLEDGASGDGFRSSRDALGFACKLLEGVRFEAETAGIPIALEAGAGRTLLSPTEACEIIDAANSWAVGACIDLPRIAKSGCPADWIRTLARRIQAVRLRERSELADVLDEVRYAGPVIVVP